MLVRRSQSTSQLFDSLGIELKGIDMSDDMSKTEKLVNIKSRLIVDNLRS